MTQVFTRRNIGIVAVVAVAAAAVLFFSSGPSDWIRFIVNRDTHPLLFVLLMTLLPIFGFPISLFLVVAGIKFGIISAVGVTVLTIPVHLLASYFLANSLVRPYLERLLAKRGYRMPRIPREKTALYASVFVAVPGPPYALKNYLLALSGIPFCYFFFISWILELAICIPVVGIGRSLAEKNFELMALFGALIVAVYLLTRWLKGRFSREDK
jgi:uncharacterized membrane protein YdjX (TVP38/TMEM64 family)